MNGTAIGRRRREAPLRGAKVQDLFVPSAAKRQFAASSLNSRAIHGMVLKSAGETVGYKRDGVCWKQKSGKAIFLWKMLLRRLKSGTVNDC